MTIAFAGIPHEYTEGALAPVSTEYTAWDLPVTGSIPPELDGLYLRNGPNPPPVPYDGPYHWFLPDGMLHGVRIRDGKALWYRNRWIRTEALAGKLDTRPAQGPADIALVPNTSNTNVIEHAGRILTLAEWGLPYEVDRELNTLGRHDFGGALAAPMTAHPKIDPRTGEMYLISFGPVAPYLRYFVVDATGALVRSEIIDVEGPSLMHDWAMTENHVLFLDLPIVFDADYGAVAGFPYRWDDDYGARVGIMPKAGTSADGRWFEIDPCMIIHTLNAYELGTEVVLEAARYSNAVRDRWRPDVLAIDVGATLHRWRFDLHARTVREEAVDGRTFEFPKINPGLVGAPSAVGYGVETSHGERAGFGGLLKWDLGTGACLRHDVGDGRVAAEGTFVPHPQARAEDEGWLLSYVYDPARDASDLVIVDASDFSGAPRAVIGLPQRVPLGFHGCWIPIAEGQPA
ncbi:carotenoid oxygenase family protein [Nocardia amamiensis]|uniref:carotenoid oxygenase family protein n=1 Tax=Nocardia amamiensis TaxID=404578 RepID=UPI000829C21A|nr:carotenoid oxygenase family protein [Nocardia amamiensis]